MAQATHDNTQERGAAPPPTQKQLAHDILMQWRLAQADVPAETAMTRLRRLMNRPVEPLALTVVLAACSATLLLHMFLMVMP